ncbi:MAG: YhbY family RNA-binding protein [Methanomicrobiales archaeon]|jgi:RNA-binding protein|nr:YhbY family RNA-binding protein [Methanomicrobiales archaeon]
MGQSDPRSGIQDVKPTVWIGKMGATTTVIAEIAAQVEKRGVVKVKCLKAAEVDPSALADAAGVRLLDVRGKTMVFAKRARGSRGK